MTSPTKPSSDQRVISAKWAVSVPLMVIVVSIVATNLGMYYGMDGKTAVLDTKVEQIQGSVQKIEDAVGKLATTTSAELRSLRAQQTVIREKLASEITNLRVELATVRASIGRPSDGPPK